MKAITIVTLFIGITVAAVATHGQDREAARKDLEAFVNKQTVDYDRVRL